MPRTAPYTTLAETDTYRAEYESGLLSIVHKSTGQAISMTGERAAGDFRACLKTHKPDRVIQTYLSLARQVGADWQQVYKTA